MTHRLSNHLLVVVVVVAAITTVVLFYFLIFLFRSRRTSSPAPLPPIQPLAHRRLPLHSSHSSLLPKHSFTDDPSLFSPRLVTSFISNNTDLPPTPSPSRPPRQRPLSSAGVSPAARLSTLRGVPHAPYNQIQIILPPPLAPSLRRRSSLHVHPNNGRRLSAVDMWVPVGRDYLKTSGNFILFGNSELITIIFLAI